MVDMKYRCSSCSREVGPQLSRHGQPMSFLCPHSREIAEAVEVEWHSKQ